MPVTRGSLALNGQSVTLTDSGTSGVIFDPGDLGTYTGISGAGGIFPEINNNGTVTTLQDVVTRPGGSSKAVRIDYDADEDGIEMYPAVWTPSQSVYCRWYMMFSSNWEQNWPVGLKTNRFFTTEDGTFVVGDPPNAGTVYCSTKFIWQGYPPPVGDVDRDDDLYGWGCNHACNNMEVPTEYTSGMVFGNGLPYIRTGHWYKCESWFVLNSSVNAADGVLQCWIDDVLVYDYTDWPWASTGSSNPGGQNRSVTSYGDGGWCRMWFGGNYSGASFGFPSGATLSRYEDGYYLSTTLDR